MPYLDQFFEVLLASGASDLHLGEGQPPKVRLHGEIVPVREEPVTREEAAFMLAEIAGPERWARYEREGDLDFAYAHETSDGTAARFRCNFLKQTHGYGAVFRLIPAEIATLEELGVPPVVREFGRLRSGLVLVTGPTGSGKTTTLAALVDDINTHQSRHVVTIEEPIEFVHHHKASLVTQREVPTHVESFTRGLRAALRMDADVVLVGEMRDLETIALALTAAETGLLVLGTLHTNNARKTVDRLVDVFPADQQAQVRTMLAASLRGIVAQLLLRRADGTGRVAVHEVLVANPAVGAVVREGATQKLADVIVGGEAQGMQFMDDAIWDALRLGAVSPREAYLHGTDKDRFRRFQSAEEESLAT